MTSAKEKIKGLRRPYVTVSVCLRGDLAGEYEEREKQLAGLPASNKLGGDPERARITAEMERLRLEMIDGTVEFKLEALSDPAFQKLVDAHPPRREGDGVNERDAETGFNRASFYPALIRASTVDPTLDDEDWELLFSEDGLSPGQMTSLRMEALKVNGREVDIPFSLNGSNANPD